MTMQSGSDGIADVQWSPDNGTVFAAATAGGQLQLWDLESSILSPTAAFAFPGDFSPSNTPNLGSVDQCSSQPMLISADAHLSRVISWITSEDSRQSWQSNSECYCSWTAEGASATQVLFSATSPVLFAGGSNGTVSVLRLTNAGCPSDLSAEIDDVDPLAEGDRLQAAVAANITKAVEAGG